MLYLLLDSDESLIEFYQAEPSSIIEYLLVHNQREILERIGKLIYIEYKRWMFVPAIRSGSIELVKWLLSHDLVMIPDPIGVAAKYNQLSMITPLMELGYRATEDSIAKAASAGNIDAIRELFMLRVPATERSLYKAAKHGHLETIEYLKQRGVANLEQVLNGVLKTDQVEVFRSIFNQLQGRYDNVSRMAATHRCINIIKFMYSADVSLPSDIINYAAKSGCLELVYYLISLGYTPNTSTMYYAIEGQNLDVLRTVLKIVSMGSIYEQLLNSLVRTIERRIPTAREISSKLGRLIVEEFKRTIATCSDGIDTVDCIVRHWLVGEIVERSGDGWRLYTEEMESDPLLLHQVIIAAIEHNKPRLVEHCLQVSNFSMGERFTFAKYAVIQGNVIILEQLMSDSPEILDSSLVFHAAKNGHVKMLNFLLKRGTGGTTEDMEAAAINGHLPIVKTLHKHGVKITREAAYNAATRGYLELVKYIHDSGIRFDPDIIYELVYHNGLSALVYINERQSILQKTDPLFIAAINHRLSILIYMFNCLLREQDSAGDTIQRILYNSIPGIDYLIERMIGSGNHVIAEYMINVIKPIISSTT